MPLKLFIRDGRYHYRGTVAGRRLRGSTGTSDKATAQRIAAEKEARQWKGYLDGPEAVLTFAQAAMLYRTAEKPTRFLEPVENYWKDTAVRLIIAGTIRQSAIVLLPNASGATRNRQVLVPTQAIINHAAEQGLCRKISVERFPVMKVEKDYATWEWIETFMGAASPHLGALACFMFLTGARISEALAVRWEDVNLPGRRALIRQTKIGAERWAHLPPPLVAAIANIPDRKETVFKYSSRDTAAPSWDLAVGRAGIKPLSFHACRHGFATAMLHAGVDPITTAKRGGWKDAHHLFRTYGHAMDDETVTDRIIGTGRKRMRKHKANTPYRVGPLYLVSRGSHFQIHGMINGELIRVSTRTDDLRRAKVALDELLHELESGWRNGSDDTEVNWRAVAKAMTRRHRLSSRGRGMPFQIESSDVYRLLKETGFRCAISGIEFSKRATATGTTDPWSASIDRIDNRHGYVKGNIRIVCLAANLAMNRWGYDTLLRLALAVGANARTPTPEKVARNQPPLPSELMQVLDTKEILA